MAPRSKSKSSDTKKTGSYKGESNALGHGGRSRQLLDRGVPKAVVGTIARRKKAAPGQENYHGDAPDRPARKRVKRRG